MQTYYTRTLLEGFPSPTMLVLDTERVVAMNGAAEALLGANLIGRHYITVLRQPDLLDAIEATLLLRKPRKTRFLSSEAGRATTYTVVCSPVEGQGPDQRGVMVVFEDITHLEDAIQLRRDFVGNVSHELKTPLTALLGFIETLKGAARQDPVASERFLTLMEDEATRMNRLVGDLLSLSRVEAEERMRPSDRVNITDLISISVDRLRPLADEKGSSIWVDRYDLPIWVLGDKEQLMQVLSNLIENAIKYGRGGQIVRVGIELSNTIAALRGPGVRISVTDQGEGIDPVHIPRITERFYRIDGGRSREMGGTGLGLAIVKHIINRHRGRLRVESELGEGSTFSVLLPTL
ncbi:MAG: ATP-binding protein [Pseudomonadota bacterium]